MERVADPLVKRTSVWGSNSQTVAFAVLVVALVVSPFFTYPLFLMEFMCFALFALAFNLLIGYVGLLSFGHALYFGWAAYMSAHAREGLGTVAGTRHSHRHGDGRGLRRRRRLTGDPPPGHLFCDDHAGAGANDVFRRSAR